MSAVAPGGGAVVSALPSQDANSGTLCLVTDLAMAFPVAGTDVLAPLGLGGVQPVTLPASLLALLPRGPLLDPAAARASAIQR
jgi:hypothetical protein